MTGLFWPATGHDEAGARWIWVNDQHHRGTRRTCYLIRGLIGLFSYGIDRMTDKVAATGVKADVFQEDQTDMLGKTIVAEIQSHREANHEPIVLIGHSLGADDAIKIAKMLEAENIPVDLLVTIDATRPAARAGQCESLLQLLPAKHFRRHGILRGIPLEARAGRKDDALQLQHPRRAKGPAGVGHQSREHRQEHQDSCRCNRRTF